VVSTNRAGKISKPPPSIALNGRNEAGSPWGESPEWGTFMRHILGSQFAKLYAPNAVEKSVVQLSQSVQECIFFNRLELALSEKQMPRFVRNVDSWTNWMQLL
jgi:hypothetical protein